jgi:hypothetical protein
VTRSGNTAIAASAIWTVTGSGAVATTAADFTGGVLPGGTVSFAAGETSKTITVNVAGDTAVEPDEGFTVTFSGPSANTTITTAAATGTIVNDETPNTYTLTTGTDTVTAGSGNDLILAATNTLAAADRIDGGLGTNTLQLTGGGTFNLSLPALFANVSKITAAEGLAAVGAGTDGRQTITLRNGMNVTVTVTSGTPQIGNANPENITIRGAASLDTINLGTGTDTVILGSVGETVNGGGGTALVQATAALAGALVNGGAGATTLELTTGGTAALNTATTKVTVKLDAATNLTLSRMAFVTTIGSAGADTIIALAAGQTLSGGLGVDTLTGASVYGDTFKDTTAGLNGDTIKLFGGSDVVDITDLAFASARALTYAGTTSTGKLTATDGTHTAAINFTGNYSVAHFATANDGNGGTLISFQ